MATATTLFFRGPGDVNYNFMALPSCDKGRLVVWINTTEEYTGQFRAVVNQSATGREIDPSPDLPLIDETFAVAPIGQATDYQLLVELDDLLWPNNVLVVYWEPDPEITDPQTQPVYQAEMWFTYIP